MYKSSSESIVRAHEIMNEIKEALTTNADSTFPPKHAQMDWGGIACSGVAAGACNGLTQHDLNIFMGNQSKGGAMSESTDFKEPGEPVSAAEERQANVWRLFQSVNRVLSADFFDRKKHNLDIAVLLESFARGPYYQRDETTWDSFLAACEFATDEEIREALDFFKAKEAQLDAWEPETLVDVLQAGDLFPGLAVTVANEDRSPSAIRDTTRDLIQAILFDTWPHSEAIADFGLTSQAHYEALYYPVRNREITAEALDAALGKGNELTALVRSAPSNPHRDITFGTASDELMTPFQSLEGGWPPSGVRNPDRDDLLSETHRLSREVGYVGFRDEYFDDPDVIEEWPDPAVRERELRTFWDKAGENRFCVLPGRVCK